MKDPRSENRPQHPAPSRPSSLSLSSSLRPDPPHERSAFTAVVSISGAAVSSRTITTPSPASSPSPNSLARTSYDARISNSSSNNNSSSSSRLLTQQTPARTMPASGREAGPGVCDLQPRNQANGSNSYQHRQQQKPATGGDNVLYAKVRCGYRLCFSVKYPCRFSCLCVC